MSWFIKFKSKNAGSWENETVASYFLLEIHFAYKIGFLWLQYEWEQCPLTAAVFHRSATEENDTFLLIYAHVSQSLWIWCTKEKMSFQYEPKICEKYRIQLHTIRISSSVDIRFTHLQFRGVSLYFCRHPHFANENEIWGFNNSWAILADY